MSPLPRNLPDNVKRDGAPRRVLVDGLTDEQKMAVRKHAEQFEKLTEKLDEEIERLQSLMSRVSVFDEETDEAYSSVNDDACEISSIVSMLVSDCEDADSDDEEGEDDAFAARPSRRDAEEESGASDKAGRKQNRSVITKKYRKLGPDFFCEDEEDFDPDDIKGMLMELGMSFPAGAWAEYDESTGTLTAAIDPSEHKYLKELCQKYAKRRKRR